MFDNLKTDMSRRIKMYDRAKTLLNKIKLLLQPGTIAVVVYRISNRCYKIKIPVLRQIMIIICYILNVIVWIVAGIYINVKAEIGKGFVIHCFSCIFIGAIKMGENCTVNQGVTVGNIRGSAHRPIIGNNVYFGAGSKVLGAVTIGDNVIIGANSLVITSIPDNCTVIGVPARIVSENAKSEYLKFGGL